MLRFAKTEDTEALLDIYGQYMDTPITFEYEVPSKEEFAGRIREFEANPQPIRSMHEISEQKLAAILKDVSAVIKS